MKYYLTFKIKWYKMDFGQLNCNNLFGIKWFDSTYWKLFIAKENMRPFSNARKALFKSNLKKASIF